MRRGLKNFFLAIIIFCSFFLIFNIVSSASTDIIINEIGAFELNSGYEWIEIWNIGNEPIDLTNWKFYEDKKRHGLTVSSTDSILEPNEFGIICQDEEKFLSKYPFFTGSIFDSSWGSLKKEGEEIGLIDNESITTTLFIYPAIKGNVSLEKINPFGDPKDENNWREHSVSSSVGFINESYLLFLTTTSTPDEIEDEEDDNNNDEEDDNEEKGKENEDDEIDEEIIDEELLWLGLKINEFVSDPKSGNEWVEIYQTATGSLDITDALICDDRETVCKKITGIIEASGFLVVDLLTTSFLNNNGDSILLKKPDGTLLDRVDYSNNYCPKKEQSLARKIDGVDADSILDWAITETITPNSTNIITPPYVAEKPVKEEEEKVKIVEEEILEFFNEGLILNEILPDPVGVDTENEFIEIKNISDQKIDLNGWKIGDNSRKYSLKGEIYPNELLYFLRSETKIALNNSTKEKVILIAPNGKITDEIEYDFAKEGLAYARSSDNFWYWTTEPTPGEENIFPVLDSGGIIWKIQAPTKGFTEEQLIFEAEDSYDERGGELNYFWDFGDGILLEGGEVSYSFTNSGIYFINVFASSTSISQAKKVLEIEIKEKIVLKERSIYLNEILPNPVGDESQEFIELRNDEKFEIDLSDWYLTNGNKKYFFPQSTIIEPEDYLVFFRKITTMPLNNKGAKISLFNNFNELVDEIEYGNTKEGFSYAFSNGSWYWTIMPTPALDNVISVLETSAVNSSNSTSNKKVVKLPEKLTLEQVRTKEVGSLVKTQGVVSVLPGIFGTQYFYIYDETAGIQVYSYKKDFPELKVGDFVEVTGEISIAQGAKRIKTTSKESIDILAIEKIVSPKVFECSEVNEEDAGRLAIVDGEITEIKSTHLYLDDGSGELKVYFKNGTNIKKQDLIPGLKISVIGVLEFSKDSIELWPRNQDDISIEENNLENLIEPTENKTNSFFGKYLTAGGAVAAFTGYFFRKNRKKIFSLLIKK